MPKFRPREAHELQQLDDDDLIAYLRAAHAAGERAAARVALQVLVFGFWGIVEAKVRLKVPREHVEDVAADALVRAIKASFDGRSVGEFRSWLNTIIRRTIADWYQARASRPREEPLVSEGEDAPTREPWEADDTGYVETQMLIDQCLEELSDAHRRTVEIVVLQGRPARDAEAEVGGMTQANAHQIASRFRTRLRDLLDRDNGS